VGVEGASELKREETMSEKHDRYEQAVSELEENLSLFDHEKASPEQKAILNLSNALCQIALAVEEEFQELHKKLQDSKQR